jgi:hypothetical protein
VSRHYEVTRQDAHREIEGFLATPDGSFRYTTMVVTGRRPGPGLSGSDSQKELAKDGMKNCNPLNSPSTNRSKCFDEEFVNVAIAPLFTRLKGFDDGVLSMVKVLGRVSVL